MPWMNSSVRSGVCNRRRVSDLPPMKFPIAIPRFFSETSNLSSGPLCSSPPDRSYTAGGPRGSCDCGSVDTWIVGPVNHALSLNEPPELSPQTVARFDLGPLLASVLRVCASWAGKTFPARQISRVNQLHKMVGHSPPVKSGIRRVWVLGGGSMAPRANAPGIISIVQTRAESPKYPRLPCVLYRMYVSSTFVARTAPYHTPTTTSMAH